MTELIVFPSVLASRACNTLDFGRGIKNKSTKWKIFTPRFNCLDEHRHILRVDRRSCIVLRKTAHWHVLQFRSGTFHAPATWTCNLRLPLQAPCPGWGLPTAQPRLRAQKGWRLGKKIFDAHVVVHWTTKHRMEYQTFFDMACSSPRAAKIGFVPINQGKKHALPTFTPRRTGSNAGKKNFAKSI